MWARDTDKRRLLLNHHRNPTVHSQPATWARVTCPVARRNQESTTRCKKIKPHVTPQGPATQCINFHLNPIQCYTTVMETHALHADMPSARAQLVQGKWPSGHRQGREQPHIQMQHGSVSLYTSHTYTQHYAYLRAKKLRSLVPHY